ncbi:MAG: sugar phosphate isomerase/epimerase [Lentisphaeria bacterium]|nr:sugar phosphate isomerase/epimerase [Lentisphaeria bacterium]
MTVNQTPILSAFADESSPSFDGQLDAVRRNNITHIELRDVDGTPVQKQSLATIRAFKKQADDAGVTFSAVGSGLGKCGLDDDVDEQVEMCRHLIDIAHILETPYIRMFSFHIPEDREPADCRQQVIDQLGRLVDTVSGTGVTLAHENEKKIFGDIAERCLDLCETFSGTGAFKSIFDFANYVQVGQRPLTDCWPLLKDHTEYFHIKDARLEDGRVVPPGQGDGGLKEILGEAIAGGFNKFLTLEPHLWPRYFGGTSETRFDMAAQALSDLLKAMI